MVTSRPKGEPRQVCLAVQPVLLFIYLLEDQLWTSCMAQSDVQLIGKESYQKYKIKTQYMYEFYSRPKSEPSQGSFHGLSGSPGRFVRLCNPSSSSDFFLHMASTFIFVLGVYCVFLSQ